MSKVVFIGISFLILSVSLAVVPLVQANGDNKDVTTARGNLYGDNFQGVAGIPVTVTCKNTKTTTTDGKGLYTITFPKSKCPAYHQITATTTYHGQAQTNSVLVSAKNTATMDFSFGSVSVPEFGMFTGGIATVLSAGSFLLFKKKKN
jgi:hypothetical protein